ncbi:MAG TPA: 4'-phosphopantetheinyl transferase superfamily protein [Casimicrobiaceae bacterium]|nr:4'-phosphopantetheinyl transferase superfamily protein [Casimicrobiaceae bacterium]
MSSENTKGGSALERLPAPQRLPHADASIGLWLFKLAGDSVDIAQVVHSLSPAEHTRAARFGTDLLRQRWMIGRATLRLLLGQHLGIEPSQVPLRRGVRGRPELDLPNAPDFNVSHTGDVALIGIGASLKRGERIGVDIERADRDVNADGLARRVLTERERGDLAPLDTQARRRRFLRLWTCKEAMSKATGDALSAPFRRIDVDLSDEIRLSAGPPPYTPQRWRLSALRVPQEFIATLAVWRSQ